MRRDDILKLQYFREHMALDHFDRMVDIDEYIKHNRVRQDTRVSSVKISLKIEMSDDPD